MGRTALAPLDPYIRIQVTEFTSKSSQVGKGALAPLPSSEFNSGCGYQHEHVTVWKRDLSPLPSGAVP
jgi:hypothetical protein